MAVALAMSAALGLLPSPVRAGGPLLLFDAATRTPYYYNTVSVYTDLGPSGVLTNAQSDVLVANAFAEWSAVPTSSFLGTVAGEILVGGVPTDITLANVTSILGTFNGGGIHVIYDADGSITSGYFGAPPGVAGLASPEFSATGAPELLESWAVINGTLIDAGDVSPFPGAAYGSVYTHELGHSINLAHSQTNGGVIFFGDNVGVSGCPSLGGVLTADHCETMYPFIDPSPGGIGVSQATVDQPDDLAALSNVSPAPGWPGNAGTIEGNVFLPDGVTGVTGVNVIARSVIDPLGDAVSALSGDSTQGSLGPDGSFVLNGLTPGADYLLYVDAIVDGGFSTEPATLSFFEEYWNGAGESGNVDTDDACASTPITAVAGVPAIADILLNVDPDALSLGNDDAVKVALPFAFPFCGEVYDSVWVSSNGYVTFGVGDTNPVASATALLVGPPRICGLWADHDPSLGGSVSAKEVGGNFVAKWTGVPEIFFNGPSTFSITLRPNGTHCVEYGSTNAILDALAGRSPGGGAANPGPTDLSLAPQPLGVSAETVYETYFLGDDLPGIVLEYGACGDVTTSAGSPTAVSAPRLSGNPNPFRAATDVTFQLPRAGHVRVTVYDAAGRRVRALLDAPRAAGSHALRWDGRDDGHAAAAPGVYFVRLATPDGNITRRVVRIR
jgi:hypothetical protein